MFIYYTMRFYYIVNQNQFRRGIPGVRHVYITRTRAQATPTGDVDINNRPRVRLSKHAHGSSVMASNTAY